MVEQDSLQSLCAEVAKILNVEQVDPDMPLGQMGVDSLNIVEIILACQAIHPNSSNYTDVDFNEETTLREIDAHLLACAA